MLEKISTKAPKGVEKEFCKIELDRQIEKMQELQNVLYAESKKSLLIILQGMDASGKDSTVKHVFGQINPMGIRVKSFKKPTPEEYSYDFLRRVHKHTPSFGHIHIFNRSHYEDVLVPSVHRLLSKDRIESRFGYINGFESLLADHNTVILKFFLHISREEQMKRFAKRLNNPDKYWKYDPSDLQEAERWDDYQAVYEKIFKKCSPDIPWEIIPSDDKWYRNYLIAKKVVETLKSMKASFPEGYFSNPEHRAEAQEMLSRLEKEKK